MSIWQQSTAGDWGFSWSSILRRLSLWWLAGLRSMLPATVISLWHDDSELQEGKSPRILGVTLDSKLTFETHLCEVVSKAARSLGVVHCAGKLFDCSRVLLSCFNAYVLSNLKNIALVQMSSAESHLDLLDSVVRTAERLCEGEDCFLGHKRKVGQCLVLTRYDIYHRVCHPFHEYIQHFFAVRNTRASSTLGELALVIPCCRTN